MLLGVGYAAWSKTLTINNTVTTARFDVVFSDNNDLVDNSPNTTATGTIGQDGHSLGISITGLYPSAYAGVSKTITNNSTIPVVINSAVLDTVSDSRNNIDQNSILTHRITITDSVVESNGSHVRQLISYNSRTSQGLNEKLRANPIRLAAGGSCTFVYTVEWFDESIDYPNVNYDAYKNQTLSFNYRLGYSQDTR
jgi:hypothetical protein